MPSRLACRAAGLPPASLAARSRIGHTSQPDRDLSGSLCVCLTGSHMRQLEIVHRTHYDYAEPVRLGEYRLMFRPRDSHDLRLLHTSLAIEPAAQVRYIHDAFGNSIAIAAFGEEPVRALEFVSTIQLERYGVPPDVPTIEDYARKLPFAYPAEEAPDLARYVERHYPDPNAAVSGWARQFRAGEGAE